MNQDQRAQVEDIKSRHTMADLLSRYGCRRAENHGKYIRLCCPFHSEDTPSFYVNKATDTWHCWGAGCGLHGDVIDFVGYQRFGRAWNSDDKQMFREVLEDLSGGRLPPARMPIPREWHDRRTWRPVELTPETQAYLHFTASVYFTTLLELGTGPGTPYHYLRRRGLSDETIRGETIGYAPGGTLVPALRAMGLSPEKAAEIYLVNPERGYREFMSGRIVFVEHDRMGRVLHFIGRKFAPWLGENAVKYLSQKEMTKPLYGWHRLDRRDLPDPVIFVESPPDALTARQWGFDALANTGTGLKDDYAVELKRLRRPLVIIPHNDTKTRLDGTVLHPGWEAADQWLEKIGHGTAAALPEDFKDLSELGERGEEGRAIFLTLMKSIGYEPKRRQEDLPARAARA